MSFIGKLHEISFYGLIATLISLIAKKTSVDELCEAAFHPCSFITYFLCFLFWASVLFIPIAIVCAFATKYGDAGAGLTFASENIFVIVFAHIAEELLGLILTPFWFLKDLFTRNFDGWKIVDYVTYLIEIIFVLIGVMNIWR